MRGCPQSPLSIEGTSPIFPLYVIENLLAENSQTSVSLMRITKCSDFSAFNLSSSFMLICIRINCREQVLHGFCICKMN